MKCRTYSSFNQHVHSKTQIDQSVSLSVLSFSSPHQSAKFYVSPNFPETISQPLPSSPQVPDPQHQSRSCSPFRGTQTPVLPYLFVEIFEQTNFRDFLSEIARKFVLYFWNFVAGGRKFIHAKIFQLFILK